MMIEPKNDNIQEVDGSPAQIRTERDLLAVLIFGSIPETHSWAFECDHMTSIAPADLRGAQGFESPILDGVSDTHTHTHTHRTYLIPLLVFMYFGKKSKKMFGLTQNAKGGTGQGRVA